MSVMVTTRDDEIETRKKLSENLTDIYATLVTCKFIDTSILGLF